MSLTSVEQTRRSLLPVWIRVFCWFFLVAGTLAPTLLIVGLFYTAPMQFALFGWEHEGSPFDAPSLVILAYFVASGVAAYGLLRGKPWGGIAGVIVGSIGLVSALASLTRPQPSNGGFHVPLEPLLQVPFLYVLWRIRNAWPSGVVPVDEASSLARHPVAEAPIPLLPRFLIALAVGAVVLTVYSVFANGSLAIFGNLLLSALFTAIFLLPLRFLLRLVMPGASQQARAIAALSTLLVLVTAIAFAMSPADLPQGRFYFWAFWAFFAVLTGLSMFWPSLVPSSQAADDRPLR